MIITALLGITPPVKMDGRVLVEALAGEPVPGAVIKSQTLEATQPFEHAVWRQYLKTSEYDHAFYLDEGNGAAMAP